MYVRSGIEQDDKDDDDDSILRSSIEGLRFKSSFEFLDVHEDINFFFNFN